MKRHTLPFKCSGVLSNNTFEDLKNVKSFALHIKVFLLNQKVEENLKFLLFAAPVCFSVSHINQILRKHCAETFAENILSNVFMFVRFCSDC